jgi:hypothetical protein
MTTSSRSADVSALASEDRATPFDRSAPFPTPLRPGADLAVLDVTKYFGDRTGGIRTYLLEKARYVAAHPDFRQTMVVPGPQDSRAEISSMPQSWTAYSIRSGRISSRSEAHSWCPGSCAGPTAGTGSPWCGSSIATSLVWWPRSPLVCRGCATSCFVGRGPTQHDSARCFARQSPHPRPQPETSSPMVSGRSCGSHSGLICSCFRPSGNDGLRKRDSGPDCRRDRLPSSRADCRSKNGWTYYSMRGPTWSGGQALV